MLEDVSDELLIRIFAECDAGTLRALGLSCCRFATVLQDDPLWQAVLLRHFGAPPMHRVAPGSWREEYLQRVRMMRCWTSRNRALWSTRLPGNIGDLIVDCRVTGDLFVAVYQSALIRVDISIQQGEGQKAILLKRSVHYYSTIFSESAVLSAAAVDSRQCIMGFSDGSVVVVNGLPSPDGGWDDCRWYTLMNAGPPVIKLVARDRCLLVVGQRTMSESHAVVQLFSLKTKGRLLKDPVMVPDYSFCDLGKHNNALYIPERQGVLGRVDGCDVGKNCLFKGERSFPLAFGNFYCHDDKSVVFQQQPSSSSSSDLLFFSPRDFMLTARVKLPKDLLLIDHILVIDEAVIVAGSGQLIIIDSVGGELLARRSLKRKGQVRIVWAGAGSVWFMNGPEFCILQIIERSAGPKSRRKVAPKTNEEEHRVSIDEGMADVCLERAEDERMERLRSRMNIEGLSEAELIQYAILLSKE